MRPKLRLPALSEDRMARRILAGAATVLVHATLLASILTVPLYQLPDRSAARSAGGTRGQVYTVSGINAQTDAPLNEPQIGSQEGDGSGEGDAGGEPGLEDAPARTSAEAEDAELAPDPDASDAATPEAGEETAVTGDPSEADAAAEVLTAPGSGNPGLREGETAAATSGGTPAARPDRAPVSPNQPVSTTQPGETRAPGPVEAPPSFADILARVDPTLDPEDFLVRALEGDTNGAVRESLCLSSSEATLQAAGCPDEPNPAQGALAAYGLTRPGELPPQFLIDLDRLAFQLNQLGANPSRIEALMLGVADARRREIERSPLERQMGRDTQAGSRDNLGVSNPFGNEGIPMPDDPDG
jgi:hypothetical protein